MRASADAGAPCEPRFPGRVQGVPLHGFRCLFTRYPVPSTAEAYMGFGVGKTVRIRAYTTTSLGI